MSDNLELTAAITTEEPEVAATLDELRFLVFKGKQGDTGDSAYEEAVKLGFEGTEAEWLASLKGDPGESGFVLVTVDQSGEEPVASMTSAEIRQAAERGKVVRLLYGGIYYSYLSYYEGTAGFATAAPASEYGTVTALGIDVDASGGVTQIFGSSPARAAESDMSDWEANTYVDGAVLKYTIENLPGGSANAVLYTAQSLSDSQKAQARTNVGAGTYSKPSGGIPASDLAAGVIPTVPQMATQTNMSDWTSGKTVDAAALKTGFQFALQQLDGKASQDQVDAIGLHVDDLDLDVQALQNAGYQTAHDVQTAIAEAAELPAVTASDNGKFLRVVSGAWAAETVSTWQGGSY